LALRERLLQSCAGNAICIVEAAKKLVESNEADEETVKLAGSMLGQPSRKSGVFLSRYLDVFSRLVQKHCSVMGEREYCIYSWNPRVPIRYFPVGIDATGTILAFDKSGIPRLVSYPVSRTLDIEGHGVSIPNVSENPVVEISKRADGYQVSFYFNPDLKRWIPSTRYLLHNMRYEGRNLIIADSAEDIINPYALIADRIAEEAGLYEKLSGWEGRTVNFILLLEEPATVRPNVDLASPERCKLLLLNYRDESGRLSSISEAVKELMWEHVVESEKVRLDSKEELYSLIEKARQSLEHRSHFLRFERGEPQRPLVIEVKSKLYAEAMNVKYMSDPKSYIILISEGKREEALGLLVDYEPIKQAALKLAEHYTALETLVDRLAEGLGAGESIIERLLKGLQDVGAVGENGNKVSTLRSELERARRTKNTRRLARVLALAVLGETMIEAEEGVSKLVSAIKAVLQSQDNKERSKNETAAL